MPTLFLPFITKPEKKPYYKLKKRALHFGSFLLLFVVAAFIKISFVSNNENGNNKTTASTTPIRRQLFQRQQKDANPYYLNLVEFDDQQFENGTQPHLGYVHIGKCGGVSVERAINRWKSHNAILQQGIVSYHLMPPAEVYVTLLKHWMFSIRDPIERIRSNWIFAHPQNNKYRKDHTELEPLQLQLYRCYPSLNDAATRGLTFPASSEANNNNGSYSCPELLRRVFMGDISKYGPQLIHYGRGYRYYLEPFLKTTNNGTTNSSIILDEKSIYVVRQEHMEDDLNSINVAFGGSPKLFPKKIHSIDHFWDTKTDQQPKHMDSLRYDSLPYVDRYLSPEGITNLCWILCDEIQVYKQLLRRAKNLEKDQYQDSMTRLAEHCPNEAAAASDNNNYQCPMFLSSDWINTGIPT
eukprot:CAMPEP_0194229488 /NCGR_PEP_ID=MMETSP0156-20130528/43917_1 /TAXON_ID=33649 /ORGANISM="Thalassionema nitzschioides, Strain L26-B" /LENGTH=409 /DNA_ID=CAMNT_0038962041 /DNA_START=31 /DNA_END=1260 /DNA_ORIENTATION=-